MEACCVKIEYSCVSGYDYYSLRPSNPTLITSMLIVKLT